MFVSCIRFIGGQENRLSVAIYVYYTLYFTILGLLSLIILCFYLPEKMKSIIRASVCMATYNGSLFIVDQLLSILNQIGESINISMR